MSTTPDPLWDELQSLARNDHARLEDRYGTCPICGLNASDAITITSITWALCNHCEVRWAAGESILKPEFDRKRLRFYISIGARYAAAPPHVERRRAKEPVSMTTDANTTPPAEPSAIRDFDPWPRSLAVTATLISDPPAFWRDLSHRARARLFATVVWQVAVGGQRGIIARVMNVLEQQRAAGDAIAAQLLNELRSPDMNNRAPVQTVARKIELAGDAIAFLEQQRATLDEAIARLRPLTSTVEGAAKS